MYASQVSTQNEIVGEDLDYCPIVGFQKSIKIYDQLLIRHRCFCDFIVSLDYGMRAEIEVWKLLLHLKGFLFILPGYLKVIGLRSDAIMLSLSRIIL